MATSINFSEKELLFLQDTDFLMTKQKIQEKLGKLLADCQQTIKEAKASTSLPPEVWKSGAKISRGENYQTLPYLVLDYPRHFRKDEIFAFRSMCWWGHELSCTLHLEGGFWSRFQEPLLNKLHQLEPNEQQNIWLCVNSSPWQYHFEPDNYQPLSTLLEQEQLLELKSQPFFKVSRRIGLAEHEHWPEFCRQSFLQFCSLLQ